MTKKHELPHFIITGQTLVHPLAFILIGVATGVGHPQNAWFVQAIMPVTVPATTLSINPGNGLGKTLFIASKKLRISCADRNSRPVRWRGIR